MTTAPEIEAWTSRLDEVTAPNSAGGAGDFPCALLVRVAGLRWSIKSLFEQATGEAGLDQ